MYFFVEMFTIVSDVKRLICHYDHHHQLSKMESLLIERESLTRNNLMVLDECHGRHRLSCPQDCPERSE
jgi:hypothetical protein